MSRKASVRPALCPSLRHTDGPVVPMLLWLLACSSPLHAGPLGLCQWQRPGGATGGLHGRTVRPLSFAAVA